MDEEFENLKNKAESGDMDAQFNLGYMYYFGYGVEQDSAKAKIWFNNAEREKLKIIREMESGGRKTRNEVYKVYGDLRKKELEFEKKVFLQISEADKIYFCENYLGKEELYDIHNDNEFGYGRRYAACDWYYPWCWDFKDVVGSCNFNTPVKFFCYAMFDNKVNKLFRNRIENYLIGDFSRVFRWSRFCSYEMEKNDFLLFGKEFRPLLIDDFYCKGLKFQTVYKKFEDYYRRYNGFLLPGCLRMRQMFALCMCNDDNPDKLLELEKKLIDNRDNGLIAYNYNKKISSLENEIKKKLNHTDTINYLYFAIKYKVPLKGLVLLVAELREKNK